MRKRLSTWTRGITQFFQAARTKGASNPHLSPEQLGIKIKHVQFTLSIPDENGDSHPAYMAVRDEQEILMPKSWRVFKWNADKQDYVLNIDPKENPDGKRLYSTFEMFRRLNLLENPTLADLDNPEPDDTHFSHDLEIYETARQNWKHKQSERKTDQQHKQQMRP